MADERDSLHPLAVEDTLRALASPRSKLDFYRSHLYCQILVQYSHRADEKALQATGEGLVDGHMGTSPTGSGSVPHRRGLWDRLTGHSKDVVRGMQLPEGVEGVFEPSVGGTTVQHERGVSALWDPRDSGLPVDARCSHISKTHTG